MPWEHFVLGPQGDGTQASWTGDGVAAKHNRCTDINRAINVI